MSTHWEEGRGAPLDCHPLQCNPIELGVYPKRSATYQTLSAEDEADRAREIQEGIDAARASAAIEIQRITKEKQARKQATVEDCSSNEEAVESMGQKLKSADKTSSNLRVTEDISAQPNSTGAIQGSRSVIFEDIPLDVEARAGRVSYRISREAEVVEAHSLVQDVPMFRGLRRLELALNMKLGIELEGVTRIQETDRNPPAIWNVFLMWVTVTCHAGTLPIGLLGAEFGLSFHQSIAAILVGNILGSLCTAFCGTLGPKTGLRAIATSRYSFGFYGAKLASILSIIVGGGFGVVNVVVVGQLLSAVSGYHISIAVGCVIIAVISYFVSLFGFQLIHTFEKYGWIPTILLLIILAGEIGPKVDVDIPGKVSGLGLAGAFLTFVGINFSSTSGWCSLASDYYVHFPATTSSMKIFWLSFFGVCMPTVFATCIGAALGNIAIASAALDPNPNALLYTAFKEHKFGGLLLHAYYPIHFSKFALVLLMFSVLGNNIAVNYSNGLSIQLLGHYFHAIPRFCWSFINALFIGVLAIAGRENLSIIIENFVSLLGYWTISFTLILLIEDQFYRKRLPLKGYRLQYWDVPRRLPLGVAAVLALLAGYLGGGVPGMAKPWYIGPVAAKFGPLGGDVGTWMSGAITVLVYVPARWYELKFREY